MKYQEYIRRFYLMSEDEKADRISRFADNTELLHACLGLSGEVGEVVDIIKKHVAYGKGLDKGKLIEELGDVRHYLARVCDLLGFNEADIEAVNTIKLNKRFKDGYTDKAAILQGERNG